MGPCCPFIRVQSEKLRYTVAIQQQHADFGCSQVWWAWPPLGLGVGVHRLTMAGLAVVSVSLARSSCLFPFWAADFQEKSFIFSQILFLPVQEFFA